MASKRGRPKTKKRIIVEELCEKHSEKSGDYRSTHGLASMIMNGEHAGLFKNFEEARVFVRQSRGACGDNIRKVMARKDLYQTPSYSKVYLDTKDSPEYKKASKRKLKKSKYYIITWAQNNTKIHDSFWDNILAYANFLGASIHVILGRYKNPTQLSDNDPDEHWDPKVIPYMDANRHSIHKKLKIMSDIKIQPTAVNPLTGLESMSGLESSVFGHPKMNMDTIAALEGYEPKIILTTGAVTNANYSDSKAGKKGAFHHVFGFVIVEIQDKEVFHIRQVTALANGSFCDLIHSVKDGKVSIVDSIDYMNLGDKHIGEHCLDVERQQRRILDRLKPKHTIIQDVYNGTSVNPHEDGDPIKKYLLQKEGKNLIRKEVQEMLDWIDSMKQYNLVIVPSNHNDWLDRYIKRQDWKKDIHNAMEYIEYSRILLSGQAPKGLVAYLIDQRFGKQVKTLSRNDSFRVHGIELAQHGDIGTNGSRGGVAQFRKLSTKMDVGHSHVPKRIDGVMYVGTSTYLRVGYTLGASSWKHADIICHKNGKRQHVFYVGKSKEFTTFDM